ncbi:hypothetical protein Ahy_B03g066932 [Arachis hypogaea]|uniref:DUF4283 domain-containing protein n=1 Tax=Arachis hypogaea TaxID=3818 RepID=A0A445A5J9_ARAHY|nr:hypothetical protein Ahy_B03g066932 [Arachis hypogaea]
MEEDDSFSESEEELTEKSNREREVNGKQNKARDDKDQESSIRVEKVAGIYNIVINEASMKSLRNTWWECLIVKLLGRRISLAVLTRKLEALWSKMGSIDVIDIGNNFFIVRFLSQEDLDFALTGGPWKIFLSLSLHSLLAI